MRVTKSHLFLFLTSLGFSFVLVFSTFLKNSGMSSLEQVLLRIFVALALLLPFLFLTGRLKLPTRKHLPIFTAIGIAWGMFLFSALSAIALGAPIVVVGALTYTQPIYTAIISLVTGSERASPRKAIPILIAIIGAFLASGFYLPHFNEIKTGIAFAALIGPIYAAYLKLKRNTAVREYPPLSALANTMIFSVPAVIIMGGVLVAFVPSRILTGLEVPDSYQGFMLLLFALFSTLLPYGALNSVKNSEVEPMTEGLLLLLDSVFRVIWSVLFFGQLLTVSQYIGVALMTIALFLCMREPAPAIQ